jgi:LysM repeat protein
MAMTTGSFSIQQAIQNATQAMQRGDKHTARYWAQIAASAAPGIEEPWLILAAVSSPRAGIEYLKQALLVNPGSQRAMRGLSWAQDRLARQLSQSQAVASSMSATQPIRSATQPIPTQPLRLHTPLVKPAPMPAPHKKPDTRPARLSPLLKKLSMPALFLMLACIVAAWAAWPGSTSSALALIGSGVDTSMNGGPAWSLAEIARPTYTATATATIPPTTTPLPAATSTPVPADTSTPAPLPTDSPVLVSPTDVPPTVSVPLVGTYTVQAGDTLSSIAQRAGITTNELAAANQISTYVTIYAGQVLGIPQGGSVPDPVTPPAPDTAPPAQYGEKYILVDISEQHLYAYQGDALIYSFVASTGMNNATSVGVFHVLDKIPNAYGANWNIWMPNWMGIYYAGGLENGIHALPILPGGSRLWAGYLGTPISYGCVVLGVQEAQWLYDWAEVGTTVEIRW